MTERINTQKFWSRVRKAAPDECWEWTPPYTTFGYGQQMHNNRLWRSHRLSWTIHRGPIPQGQCVCHKCDNPKCVNPSHLFLGTQRDNLRDMVQKKRNHTMKKGEWLGAKNVRAKLTEDDVRSIRREYVAGSSLRVLSRKYGIAHTAIASVLKRRTWAHVA